MAENLNLNKEVFNKRAYLKTIDTSFNELGVKTIQEQIDEQPTVQEFFNMYNTLFYQINELGPTNSHEYLIKTSQEYIGAEQDNELIRLLQAEITNLRKDLLESQQQLAELANSVAKAVPNLPEVPKIEIPESPPPPTPETPKTPSTPKTKKSPSNKQRVINDFKKFPNSSVNKRVNRLNLSKDFIKKIRDKNNL